MHFNLLYDHVAPLSFEPKILHVGKKLILLQNLTLVEKIRCEQGTLGGGGVAIQPLYLLEYKGSYEIFTQNKAQL